MTMADLLARYDARAPLAGASTIPAAWYTDPRVAAREREAVFARSWQPAARADQLTRAGQYVTTEIAGEPIVVVRGDDGVLRAFYNVCRHHAAAVMTAPAGQAPHLRCPYHGWTYALDGSLRGVPEFQGVCNFDRARNGLVPVPVAVWEALVFVNLDPAAPPLADWLGSLAARVAPLRLGSLHFAERRVYTIACNWKVFVDNYLDGGYHVPHLHRGLDSILDYNQYTIEVGERGEVGQAGEAGEAGEGAVAEVAAPAEPRPERWCLQSSAIDGSAPGAEAMTASVRKGQAFYYWLYPNLMLNWYEGYLDTNLVVPLGVDRMQVTFDFYFSDVSEPARARNQASMDVSERIQDEDHAICESVQRGLGSRAYDAGRLSVRREAGEHLFHRLLAADLRRPGTPSL
jgi:choline monooxygenase